jgi:hypothetical protein
MKVLCTFICCCCKKCLKKKKKRSEKDMFKGCCRRWPFYMVYIVMGFGIIFALLGLGQNVLMLSGLNKFVCSFTGLLHEMIWGATFDGKSWIGIANLSPAIQSITDTLKFTLPSKIQSTFGQNTGWMNTDYNAIKAKLTQAYTDTKDKTVKNPDPIAKQGGTVDIVPLFFSGTLGPPETENKELHLIHLELKWTIEATIKVFKNLEDTVNGIQVGSGVTAALEASKGALDDYITKFKGYETDLVKSMQDNVTANRDQIYNAALVIFSVALAFGI